MFVWQENNPFKDSCMALKMRNSMEAVIRKDFLKAVVQARETAASP